MSNCYDFELIDADSPICKYCAITHTPQEGDDELCACCINYNNFIGIECLLTEED